ncbi:hypothetical protein [Frigoriglobus tundricola]|uniref:Uncharacterized protein n=1 Tax=Frigoriglobus tundricola TaxID=2774151 RepID=A0A6M5Z3G2_9BACT|nr:hypothetical protein [Frigoriglobus tundricola]QJX00297.1 hypothetical protein FTUN_7922 [Frigoriglobus tundricola]
MSTTKKKKLSANGKRATAKDLKALEAAKAEADNAYSMHYDNIHTTALAWVTMARLTIKKLAHQAGTLDHIRSHPDQRHVQCQLWMVFDDDAVAKFIQAVYELEGMLDDLLTNDAEPFHFPRLAFGLTCAGDAMKRAGAAAVALHEAQPKE